jgi:hypothetical protein
MAWLIHLPCVRTSRVVSLFRPRGLQFFVQVLDWLCAPAIHRNKEGKPPHGEWIFVVRPLMDSGILNWNPTQTIQFQSSGESLTGQGCNLSGMSTNQARGWSALRRGHNLTLGQRQLAVSSSTASLSKNNFELIVCP